MPTAFVTGGTGFLGFNLIKLLRDLGWEVVAVHRGKKTEPLRSLGAQLRVAELSDVDSIVAAMPQGADCVFHVAGSTNFWRGGNSLQTAVNVDGTRHVVRAALAKGAKRMVHTSSAAAYGDVSYRTAVREDSVSNAEHHWVNYFRTKWLGEREVRAGIEQGLDAVIVNPPNILGPHDYENWGRLFQQVQARQVPGLPSGSGAWAYVDDIAGAHLAAFEKGRCGENYLLGGPVASYGEVIRCFCNLSGAAMPRTVPAFLLKTMARIGDVVSSFTRRAPDITPELAYILTASMQIDDTKAKRELDYSTRPIDKQVEGMYSWMKTAGLIK